MTKRKYEQKQEEKITSIRERASAMKDKEKVCSVFLIIWFILMVKMQATMDMFQQLAKQRFG
jgi:hypothetical protein